MSRPSARADSPRPEQHRSSVRILRDNIDSNAFGPIRTLGRSTQLGAATFTAMVLDTIRGRLPVREVLIQAWFLTSVTAVPAVLMAIPFGVIVTVQVGNIVGQIGATQLLGAASGIAMIQQAAPLAAGLLLGGAGASAIAADLGARTIRDEVDALRTMGVDPINRLVVPRLIAAIIVAPLLNLLIVVVGILAAFYVSIIGQDVTPGSYWLSFGSFATVGDLVFSTVKAMLFGVIISIVGCHFGLEARGGSRGVADAVNATVVVSTVGIIVLNLALTQAYTVFFPTKVG